MKTTRGNTKQSKQGISHKPSPEIRDNLDSRKTKEIVDKSKKEKK